MGVKWVTESGYDFILLASLHGVTHWSSRVIPTSGCPNFQFEDYDGKDLRKPGLGHLVVPGEW